MANQDMHIEVELVFRTAEQGGRNFSTLFLSDYQDGPKFDYGGTSIASCRVSLPDRVWVAPGEQVTALVNFLEPEHLAGELYIGKEFTLREGFKKIIANGRVTSLLEFEEKVRRMNEPKYTSWDE